jgi:hypothetical protein
MELNDNDETSPEVNTLAISKIREIDDCSASLNSLYDS